MSLFSKFKDGTCDVCPNVGKLHLMYGDIWMCAACEEANKKADTENYSDEAKQARVNQMLDRARQQDQSIELDQQLFNAATVSIAEIAGAVENDSTVENKRFAVCKILEERIDTFGKAIFDARKTLNELENSKRAFQSELMRRANELTEMERSQIKLKDVTYSVKPPKAVKTTAKPGTPKFNLVECKKWADYFKVPAEMIRAISMNRKLEARAAGLEAYKLFYKQEWQGE
jgi:hypothetical protein